MMAIFQAGILGAAALATVAPVSGGFDEMVRSGQWGQLLQVANRRADQLPLRPEEAYLAAHAARELGDRGAEERHLARAADGGDFAQLARLQLAELLVLTDQSRAVDLVLPMIRRAETRAIRSAAVTVAVEALGIGLDSASRHQLDRIQSSLPRSHRRRLELALAASDSSGRRKRLGRLLATSTDDLVALEAARMLQAEEKLSVEESWWVAQSLYRHALYQEAQPMLEELDGVRHRAISRWRVAYLRGRCAFRQGRWDEAIEWYRKAMGRTSGGERRADLEVHHARALELAGRVPEAVEAAKRAVSLRTTDPRRLLLARLRLQLDQPDHARAGISRIRGRGARSRGELLLALHDLRHGRPDAARSRLGQVRHRPWTGPAAVLAAEIAFDQEDFTGALAELERGADDLDPFWAERARALMVGMPHGVVATWRATCAARLAASDPRSGRRALGRWARLETDHEIVSSLRERVGRREGVADPPAEPGFSSGLAGRLWRVGLHAEAARWDPGGMPSQDVPAAAWSASKFLELEAYGRAIRTADAAWRMAGTDVPMRVYPEGLRRSLHPLPNPELVWRAAVDNSVPWSLLAAVAREESRWVPDVVSRVGARGLMQLMPATAEMAAGRRSLPSPSLDQLFDPAVSLELGAAELGRLLDAFEGQWAPVVAAYNAGEAQARLWREQCGDPCPSELYVATISFSTTRAYTRDVLASAATYVELYGASLRSNGRVAGNSNLQSSR